MIAHRSRSTHPFATRALWGFFTGCTLVGLLLAQTAAEPKSGAAPGKSAANKYIGADKCKNCHNSEATGAPYGHWMKTGHAKAFETLASPKAKEIAKAKGIDDPQKSDQCMKCHQTAFGVAADEIKKGFDAKMGVQCESCHGPGEQHMKARMAAAAKAGGEEGFGDEKGAAAAYQKLPAGEILSNVDQKTCVGCHNEQSPTYQPFCFYERTMKIAHFDPRKPRTAEDKLVCACGKCGCEQGCEIGKGKTPEPK